MKPIGRRFQPLPIESHQILAALHPLASRLMRANAIEDVEVALNPYSMRGRHKADGQLALNSYLLPSAVCLLPFLVKFSKVAA